MIGQNTAGIYTGDPIRIEVKKANLQKTIGLCFGLGRYIYKSLNHPHSLTW